MNKYMPLNDAAITALVLCLFAAVSSTRLFLCRTLGFSVESLYRWTAILPVILIFPFWELAAQPGLGTASACCIVLAFGLGFSVASLRTPKLYARIVGGVLFLIYAFYFYLLMRGLHRHEAAA